MHSRCLLIRYAAEKFPFQFSRGISHKAFDARTAGIFIRDKWDSMVLVLKIFVQLTALKYFKGAQIIVLDIKFNQDLRFLEGICSVPWGNIVWIDLRKKSSVVWRNLMNKIIFCLIAVGNLLLEIAVAKTICWVICMLKILWLVVSPSHQLPPKRNSLRHLPPIGL